MQKETYVILGKRGSGRTTWACELLTKLPPFEKLHVVNAESDSHFQGYYQGPWETIRHDQIPEMTVDPHQPHQVLLIENLNRFEELLKVWPYRRHTNWSIVITALAMTPFPLQLRTEIDHCFFMRCEPSHMQRSINAWDVKAAEIQTARHPHRVHLYLDRRPATVRAQSKCAFFETETGDIDEQLSTIQL